LGVNNPIFRAPHLLFQIKIVHGHNTTTGRIKIKIVQ